MPGHENDYFKCTIDQGKFCKCLPNFVLFLWDAKLIDPNRVRICNLCEPLDDILDDPFLAKHHMYAFLTVSGSMPNRLFLAIEFAPNVRDSCCTAATQENFGFLDDEMPIW